MKYTWSLVILLAILFLPNQLSAETWDEPWQKEIIKNADYFVLAKVISENDSTGADIEVIKSFGANSLNGKINILDFYILDLTSASGHGVHLQLKADKTYYLFLKKGEGSSYNLPTPTSGFAQVEDGKVKATYRHSYHQALIPQSVYEDTYHQIWSYYKSQKFDETKITSFIQTYLTKEPAGFDKEEIDTFFLQHAAMGTAYLLDMKVEFESSKKFLEFDNFHAKISALQLLKNHQSNIAAEYLFNFIANKKNDDFQKVIAIWSLWEIGGDVYRKKLIGMKRRLSDEDTGFGGNIMDPRVGTSFPSPREAVLALSKK